MSREVRKFFEEMKAGKDIELSKEAVMHLIHDQRNIPEAPTIEANVIIHVQADMSPQHIAASMNPEPGLAGTIKGIGGDIWDALTPAFSLGAEEITRVLFTGNGYVFHGDTIPQEMQQDAPPMQKQQEGREMDI